MDWISRGDIAEEENDDFGAIYFWKKALSHSEINEKEEYLARRNLVFSLDSLSQSEDVITQADLLLNKFGRSKDVDGFEILLIRLSRASSRLEAGDFKRGESELSEIEEEYKNESDVSVISIIARHNLMRPIEYLNAGRYEDAIRASEDVERRYSECRADEVVEICSTASFLRMLAFGRSDRRQEAISAMKAIVTKYGDVGNNAVKLIVGRAKVAGALLLSTAGEQKEALKYLSQVVTMCRAIPDDESMKELLNEAVAAIGSVHSP